MLLKVQAAVGELYLEIGMAQEGFQYFKKAWLKLMEFSPSDLKDNQDLVKQKGQLGMCRRRNLLCFRVRHPG